MADETKNQMPEQGIFEPKPLSADRIPVSGTVRAIRFAVFLLMVTAGVLIWLALRNPFMRPLKAYYKGLSARDPAAMSEAFPDWLVSAQVSEDAMTVTDMCAAMVSASRMSYGQNVKAEVSLVSQQEVGADYLDRLAAGIRAQYQRDVEVTKGWRLTLMVSYTADGREQSHTEYARVYRIDGAWRLLDVPGDTQ